MPKGFRLIVAIADVSYYVRRGTALDASARERGTSVYFPTRVIPMLPFALSNVLCSLQPQRRPAVFRGGHDRLEARACCWNRAVYPAVMRSVRRLTYDQAFAALFEKRPDALRGPGGRSPTSCCRWSTSIARCSRRGTSAARSSSMPPRPSSTSTPSGASSACTCIERNEAHKLIEECMILANVAVARELELRRIGTLYRVHGKPEEKKLNLLLETLNALGVAAEFPEEVSPRDFRAITDRLGHDESRPFIESLIVRSMMQAVYQPQNIGHFGLALKHYAHFTSPIRRYPDLVVHRCLRAMLSDADPYGMRYDGGQLALAGAELTQLEKRADESDRYVNSWLKCVYLRDRIGQTFEGLITTVVEFGAFVQLTAVGTDGLLHIDNLRDDEYVMEPGGRAWVGRASKRRLSLGARVHVIVTSVNPIEGLVDLSLVTVETPGKIGLQKSPHRHAKPQGQGQGMSEKVYGLHAVRALLTRHAERVTAVTIAEQRADPRMAEIQTLAQKAGKTVKRAPPAAFKTIVWRCRAPGRVRRRAAARGLARRRTGRRDRRAARSDQIDDGQAAVRAGARRRAGSSQPGRVPAHRGCLRRAGRGDPEGSRRADERHRAQGGGRRRRDHAHCRRHQSRAHAAAAQGGGPVDRGRGCRGAEARA